MERDVGRLGGDDEGMDREGRGIAKEIGSWDEGMKG